MKIGMLTSGGDCPGLNAVMRAFAKYVCSHIEDVKIFGFLNGYTGLIENEYEILAEKDFEPLLLAGGTVLGSKRQPFKQMTVSDGNNRSKLDKMKETYEKLGLDCLVTLGGAGTHKTAALLSSEGCRVIGLPKTIDNDIWGTDVTFGFSSAMEIATECIDRRAQHGGQPRPHHAGGGRQQGGLADLIRGAGGRRGYDSHTRNSLRRGRGGRVSRKAQKRGARDTISWRSRMRLKRRGSVAQAQGNGGLARLARGNDGHGTPGAGNRGADGRGDAHAGDRLPPARRLAQRLRPRDLHSDGKLCGRAGRKEKFGVTVAMAGGKVTYNSLADIAGKTKSVPPTHQLVRAAKAVGISFGESAL